jgi:hypothetical protein
LAILEYWKLLNIPGSGVLCHGLKTSDWKWIFSYGELIGLDNCKQAFSSCSGNQPFMQARKEGAFYFAFEFLKCLAYSGLGHMQSFCSTHDAFLGKHNYAVNRISKFLDKSGQALMSLFSPEDTTNNGGEGQLQIAKHMAYNTGGLTKAVFWIAISISMALWIGPFKC